MWEGVSVNRLSGLATSSPKGQEEEAKLRKARRSKRQQGLKIKKLTQEGKVKTQETLEV